MKSKQGNR